MKTDIKPLDTVLVLDPDADVYARLRELTSTDGLQWHTYRDATSALRSARMRTSVALLIAVELPDMNGFDALRLFRQRERRTPICLVGQTYRPEDERRAMLNRATMYVCRPLNSERMAQFVRHVSALRKNRPMPWATTVAEPSREEAKSVCSPIASSLPWQEVDELRSSDRGPPGR